MARERKCWVCGCTGSHACPGGCAWAPGPGRPICTRCADVLKRLEPYRAELTVKGHKPSAFELAAFGLGVRAAIRIGNELRGGGR